MTISFDLVLTLFSMPLEFIATVWTMIKSYIAVIDPDLGLIFGRSKEWLDFCFSLASHQGQITFSPTQHYFLNFMEL